MKEKTENKEEGSWWSWFGFKTEDNTKDVGADKEVSANKQRMTKEEKKELQAAKIKAVKDRADKAEAAERAKAEARKAASEAAKAAVEKPNVKAIEVQEDIVTTKKPIVAKKAINKKAKAAVEPNMKVVQSSKKSEKTSAKPRDNKLGASNTGGSFVDTANDLLNE